jgi:hypothetical protein
MSVVTITIRLPEEPVKRAQAYNALSDAVMEQLLRDEMAQRKVARRESPAVDDDLP